MKIIKAGEVTTGTRILGWINAVQSDGSSYSHYYEDSLTAVESIVPYEDMPNEHRYAPACWEICTYEGEILTVTNATYFIVPNQPDLLLDPEAVPHPGRTTAVNPNETTEYRKGNIFLVVHRDDTDTYFWQFQEGARRRLPFASGIGSQADVSKIINRFGGVIL